MLHNEPWRAEPSHSLCSCDAYEMHRREPGIDRVAILYCQGRWTKHDQDGQGDPDEFAENGRSNTEMSGHPGLWVCFCTVPDESIFQLGPV